MNSLYSTLGKLRVHYAKLLPAEKTAIMDRHIEFLRASGAIDRILKEGHHAPDFELKDGFGKVVSSKELLARGPLIVSFYRGAWCPYCVEEIKAFNEAYDEIKALGAELVVISPQATSFSEKQQRELGLKYSILVDENNEVGKAFNLVYSFPDDLRSLYSGVFKLDITQKNGANAWELPIPARFVIDRSGTIRDMKADSDYRFRPEPSDSVDVLKAIQRVP
jgi:peroxiredoxin